MRRFPPTHQASRRAERKWRNHAAAWVWAALTAALFTGCSNPLFSPEDERTPFDRFDTVRNQFAPQYIEDEFGAKKPNLRARLSPKS